MASGGAAAGGGAEGDVLALLDGAAGVALLASVREPWIMRGLLAHHARTGSSRALDLLTRAPDAHARLLLDMLAEQLRGDRATRVPALAALAPLVARRPAWLHLLPGHHLPRELLRVSRVEREPLPLLHALLTLAALLPAAPALTAPTASHWPDLLHALLRPAALEPPPAPPVRAHLQLAQLALFHALYALQPCTLMEALRAELTEPAARDLFQRSLLPLLHTVRLHPALLAPRGEAARWARLEPDGLVADTRRLSLRTPERVEEPAMASPAPYAPVSPAPGSGAAGARLAATLRPGTESWFALADRCAVDSAPHTPQPADDLGEPCEAAVEATPENTPAKETRAQFRFPAESGAVRAIGRRSRPASPPRKEASPPADAYTTRISRVLLERRAAESPVPMGGAPPSGAARPEPRPPLRPAPEPEDREVRELTAPRSSPAPWPAPSAPSRPAAPPIVPRSAPGVGAPPRRPQSCPPRALRPRVEAAAQTEDTWPQPYEFLIADFYKCLPDDIQSQGGGGAEPGGRLDAYLGALYAGERSASRHELAEQLALVHAQLLYERGRRDAHAERNRRLLGRCREARALELDAAALKDRVRALTRQRDDLRASLVAHRQHPAPPNPGDARLAAALADEREARLRADARRHEAEAELALTAAELRRARGEAQRAARSAEALARAAALAERRAEDARSLRRELVSLASRESAGSWGAGSEGEGAVARGTERALRVALAKAEGEATAGAARAEALAARAHELEGALGTRDAALAELKRAWRLAAEEQAARLASLHDKYRGLMHVLCSAEERKFETAVESGRPVGLDEAAGGPLQ